MSRTTTKLGLILGLLHVGLASPAAAQAGFVSSGKTATLDCSGGGAAITGSNNVLTITGNCTDLRLTGSNNKISIQLGSAARINFVGSNNAIAWTSANGKPPTVNYVGLGNTMTPPVQ